MNKEERCALAKDLMVALYGDNPLKPAISAVRAQLAEQHSVVSAELEGLRESNDQWTYRFAECGAGRD